MNIFIFWTVKPTIIIKIDFINYYNNYNNLKCAFTKVVKLNQFIILLVNQKGCIVPHIKRKGLLANQITYWINPANITNKTIEIIQLFYDI
jgi:hypothetical protein